jgi:hypothetical protein
MLMNHLQVVLRFILYLAVIISCYGCGDADRARSPSSSVHPLESSDPTDAHPAEVAAEKLVSVFSRDELTTPRPTIPVLSELGDDAREEAFQILGQYIRSQRWTLWFTEIVVSDGKDDVATCFFRGSTDGHLALMLAFQNDAWIVTAYKIPEKPWARVHGEAMEEYVSEMVAQAKEQGEPYHKGTLADGLYLLEH